MRYHCNHGNSARRQLHTPFLPPTNSVCASLIESKVFLCSMKIANLGQSNGTCTFKSIQPKSKIKEVKFTFLV